MATHVNSQLVSLLPVGIFTHVMSIFKICLRVLITLALNSPIEEWPIKFTLTFYLNLHFHKTAGPQEKAFNLRRNIIGQRFLLVAKY